LSSGERKGRVVAEEPTIRVVLLAAVQMPPSDVFVHEHTTLRLRSGKTA
jgi:hypothetical protein